MIKVVKDIDPVQWNQLVDKTGNASFFQTPACLEFYQQLGFLEGFALGVEDGGQLKAVVCGYIIADGGFLKRIMSKRAIVPGGILCAEDVSMEQLDAILRVLKKHLAKRFAIYIEFRNYHDYSTQRGDFENNGFEYKAHLNFHIALTDVENALMNLNTTKRRDVRSSLKQGATWGLSTDEQEMKEYFVILKDLYKTRIKTPLFPEEFFLKLIQSSGGRFLVVKFDGKVIGGSVCVELPGRILYEWFVCGKDYEYKNLYPSTVATWAAIEYAAGHGLHRFDMMGAGKPEEGYGVREFKSKFGGELVEHGRFLCILNPFLYFIGKKAVQYLKKINKA
jgi:lipid II:glycine glycyltransferase (peptidoglycan interpeptide bridge formation enzyme)